MTRVGGKIKIKLKDSNQ